MISTVWWESPYNAVFAVRTFFIMPVNPLSTAPLVLVGASLLYPIVQVSVILHVLWSGTY